VDRVQITRGTFESAAYESDIDIDDDIRWEAAGSFRGMSRPDYQYPAIIVEGVGTLASFAANLALTLVRDPRPGDPSPSVVPRIVSSYRSDSMGHDAIYGFPLIDIID
jgi:hypothetical protein